MVEPFIQDAIDYESGRDAAQNALRRAAGLAVDPGSAEVFSRGIQRNAGIGVGMILFGVAMGGFFAVAYILVQRRTRLRPRVLALLVAGAGFLGLYVVPFLKYPANPPAVGHEDTIGQRTQLYLLMVVLSVAFLIGAVVLARRLVPRFGTWNATLLAGGAYIVVMAIVMAILPPLGHLHTNVVAFGRQVTETPLPLRGPDGRIVYPGFPADVLFKFRLYSLISQAILWGTIGLAFGALLERMLAPAGRREPAADSGRLPTATTA
jgi:putative cobalt transporter subunit CbtA